MKPRLRSYVLTQDIVLETEGPEGVKEEVLKPAGTTVFVKRPKAKDLMVFDSHQKMPMHALRALMKRIVKLEELEIDNLDGEDFDGLGELVNPPDKNGRTTGDGA